jgi:radical SAM enzyme (TIGR01210 family)
MSAARDRWVLAHRGPKNAVETSRPYAFLWEEEPGPTGAPLPTATVFLTNRECPFRCVMCDLWRNTLDERVPAGAIPAQIDYALERLPDASQIKLYNSGNFFDRLAIPPEDHEAIAERVRHFERVVVECHPSMVGDVCIRFARRIPGALEVAMGLETANPVVLERLNKRMTVETFRRAAGLLAANDVALRVFVLLAPPFLAAEETLEWACRSIDLAFDSGAEVCSVIPTRDGNGAMEALAASGAWAPPDLRALEAAHEYGLGLGLGRVFADLWDLERFFTCACSPARIARLDTMNRTQRVAPTVECDACDVEP